MPSPLLYDGILYFLKSNTGAHQRIRGQDRQAALPGATYRRTTETYSLRLWGRRARFTSLGQEGTTVVFKHGPTMEALATNKLDDRFDASPALVDGEMYLRGAKYLY